MTVSFRSDEPARLLRHMLRDSFQGHGGVAVIGGPMASGKTTLLHAFCDRAAEEGAVVLAATASGEEQPVGFGVVRQLLQHACDLAADGTDDRIQRLRTLCGAAPEPRPQPDLPTTDVSYLVGTELLAVAADRPVVVAIDDTQFLDAASLECILVAARRVRSARMLIVATNCGCPDHRCRRFLTGVGRLSWVQHVRLGRLSEAEIEIVLRERLGCAAATALAPSCRAITGGNLLLVDALADDAAATGTGDLVPARPGRTFRDAVLACVDRCSAEGLAVLHTTALLEGTASVAQIAALLGLDESTVTSHLDALEAAGLLTGLHCHHPAIAAAVTESMLPDRRQAMHRAFARLLYEENAPAAMIARQLVAAGIPALPWATEVFRAAATERSQREPDATVQYLKAARRRTQDDGEWASLTMTLASLGWRTHPDQARRYLPELVDLLRAGRLGRADAELTIRYLLWFGRVDDAVDALDRLLAPVLSASRGEAVELRPFLLWLSIWYPGVIHRVPAAEALRFSEALRTEAVGARSVEAGNVVDLMLRNGNCHEVGAEAERLLQSCRLSDHTLDYLLTALVGLSSADALDSATRWCEALMREAEAHGAPMWQAQLAAVQAEIAFRKGDVDAAAADAARAYVQVPAEDWGLWAGLPLSTLVRATTVLGKFDRAAEVLDTPVPSQLLETGFGMLYLQARGQFLLATRNPQRARLEFQACWDFMRRRGVDLPDVFPWRSHLAEVHLQLGRREVARTLAAEQMSLTAERGSHWAQGIALRLMARASDPGEARTLLQRSIQELYASGAKLELARTLTDLARCYQELGESGRASHVQRRAGLIAATCAVPGRPDGGPGPEDREVPARRGPATPKRGVDRLSTAEQRVAVHAMKGLTNVQIARRLFLTVSTVEQHLTHIYRKLNIRGRSELASVLDVAATARTETAV